MNRNDFLNMIDNTASVNRQMIGEVNELIDIFPYFQSAHMLLLKGLQTNGDVKFKNQLRISAIHIADREVLYYLLKAESSPVVDSDKVAREMPASEKLTSETEQTVIESAKNSDQLITEIEKSSGKVDSKEQHETDNNTHGHSILISKKQLLMKIRSFIWIRDFQLLSKVTFLS